MCAERSDGQAGLARQFEHVVAELKLADVGMSIHLATSAVLVNVLFGPVGAELRTASGELADQHGEVFIERIAAGFEPKHRRGQAAGQPPVAVKVLRAGIEKDEPSQIRFVSFENGGEHRPAQEVGGDEILLGVGDDGRDVHVVQHPLHRFPHLSRDGLAASCGARRGGGAGQAKQVCTLDVVELQCAGDRIEHALGCVRGCGRAQAWCNSRC